MAEGLLLQPPEVLEVKGNVIFLAGPIQGAPDWQTTATQKIHQLSGDIAVASPRKEYKEGEFVYEKQVDWESHYLARAAIQGAIMFWLAKEQTPVPGRAYGQTSRFELGEWSVKHQEYSTKLVVGIEPGFGNERYIRRRLGQDCPDVPILSSLDETCQTTVQLLQD